MSGTEKRHLILVVGGAGESLPPALNANARVVTLTEASAREALEEIFAADTVAVWSRVQGGPADGSTAPSSGNDLSGRVVK